MYKNSYSFIPQIRTQLFFSLLQNKNKTVIVKLFFSIDRIDDTSVDSYMY